MHKDSPSVHSINLAGTMTTTPTPPTAAVPKTGRLIGLASLALLLLGSAPQPAQGHVMMAGSPFNALARPDR